MMRVRRQGSRGGRESLIRRSLLAGVLALVLPALTGVADAQEALGTEIRTEVLIPFAPTDSGGITLGQPTGSATVILPTGQTTSRPVSVDVKIGGIAAAATSGSYACINDQQAEGFHAYPVVYSNVNESDHEMHYRHFTYRYDRARYREQRGDMKQFEICSVGGSSPKKETGYWLKLTGTGMAYKSDETKLIGNQWATGESKSRLSASLPFAVTIPKTPIAISGALDVSPKGQNLGTLGSGPYPKGLDTWRNNEVNGHWQGSSSGFQGTVVLGLWEFPQNESVALKGFAVQPFAWARCAEFRICW